MNPSNARIPPTLPLADQSGKPLLVEFRRVTARVARWLVMVDPELRGLLAQKPCDFLHGRGRLSLVVVETRNPPVVPVRLEMHHVARQHDIACSLQAHEHRLMPWCMTGRR